MKEVHPSLWMNNHIEAHTFFTEVSVSLTAKQREVVPVGDQLELFIG
jgi:hypothetical protein